MTLFLTLQKKDKKVIRSEKKLKELSALFSTKNGIQISNAIRSLREELPFEGAIALLASHYDESNDKQVLSTIEDFFNDIKDLEARSAVIEEIRKPRKPATTSMLVASCWQSGLDYSDYLKDIANVFLTGDYPTSIECMTVISESAPTCTREARDEILKMIEESKAAMTHEKFSLTLELKTILKS